jgi:DNA-binding response OmpR family regulator
VLVVEPDAAQHQLLLCVLDAAHQPAQRMSAAQALGWLTVQPARLLLIAVDRADQRRLGQAQALVAAARQQGTPVLVLTEWDSDLLQDGLGADAYLAKPLHLPVLRVLVQALLALAPPTSA